MDTLCSICKYLFIYTCICILPNWFSRVSCYKHLRFLCSVKRIIYIYIEMLVTYSALLMKCYALPFRHLYLRKQVDNGHLEDQSGQGSLGIKLNSEWFNWCMLFYFLSFSDLSFRVVTQKNQETPGLMVQICFNRFCVSLSCSWNQARLCLLAQLWSILHPRAPLPKPPHHFNQSGFDANSLPLSNQWTWTRPACWPGRKRYSEETNMI